MKFILSLFVLFVGVKTKAQTTKDTASNPKTILIDSLEKRIKQPGIFTSIERFPQFPGGNAEFAKYLTANVRYPRGSFDKKVQGRVVLLMMVEKDGTIDEVKVIKSVADDIDKEAIRVLIASPKWLPAMQNGKPVKLKISIPINFTL